MSFEMIERRRRITDGARPSSRRTRQNRTHSTMRSFFVVVLITACYRTSAFSPSHHRLNTASSSVRSRRIRLPASPQSTSIIPETVNGDVNAETIITPDDEAFYMYGITPKTKTLPHSMEFYAKFVIKTLQDRRQRKIAEKDFRRGWKFWKPLPPVKADGTPRGTLWGTIKILNAQRRNVVKLAGYNAPLVIPSFVFLLLGALMLSVIPHFYSVCIQYVATNERSRLKVIRALSGLAITSTLGALFTGLRGSLFWIAGSRANYNVRVKLHRNLLLQEAAFFDSNEVGYLLSRLNNDVNKIGMVISFHVNVVLRQFAQFLFGSVYLVRISPSLSFYSFAGIGLVAVVSAIYGRFTRSLAERVQNTFADATAVAETAFSMSETIRGFDGVAVESEKYEGAQGRALELEEVQAWAYGTHKFVSDTLQGILQVLLLYACWCVGRAGGLPTAQLTTFMFYTNFVLESSNEVGDQWAKIMAAVGASTNVFDLVRRIPEVRDPPAPVPLDELTPKKEPIISMKNMTVQYGSMDVPALDSVNLDIYKGDKVAIVGRSGSGKSSMLRTILRFYDPVSGSCNLYGNSLKNLTRSEIAAKVSVVEQEPQLFPMSLIDNVLYGIEKDAIDPTTGEPCYSAEYRALVAKSLRKAGLSIEPDNELNLELDTRVGEGGRALSGGQRQRVTIARALIRNPEVLLLDEPTAALDSESEQKVVKALKRAMEETSCMAMVTHRLGVVRSLGVNRVIVLERGKIIETGDPEELLQDEDSNYSRMAREQGISPKSLPTSID